jgi:hypothetical protein
MRRTRKWAYVKQEATRLAELGLTPLEIAERLEVNRSSVQRWMAAGKVTDTRRTNKDRAPVEPVSTAGKTPSEWAIEVRRNFVLDVTDEQLVTMAEAALTIAHNRFSSEPVRLAAMGRFQAIVKQLSLVARRADEETAPTRPESPARAARTQDPRTLLTVQ